MTTDNLGSPRVVTDEDGEVIARRDFMPFGEELGAGIGPRTQNLKYSYLGSDNIRQRFTGYEKDGETGLDFAEARMYQNRHGRFTAPDPLLASASASNPQTFNRYIYTGNDPVNRTDPSGLNWCRNSDGTFKFTGENVACASGQTDFTGQTREITRSGCSNGRCNSAGTHILFRADGKQIVVAAPPRNQSLLQGQEVGNTSRDLPGQGAGDAAGASAGSSGSGEGVSTDGSVSDNITPRDLIPLPGNGGNPTWSSPLTEPADAQEIVDLIQTTADVGAATEFPIVSQVLGVTSFTIDVIRGDSVGAGMSLGGLTPFGGNVLDAAKIARRAAKVADKVHGNSKLSEKAQHGYEVFKKGERENVVATGVSGGAITKSGKSYRATRRLSEMNKSADPDLYDAAIVKTLPAGPGSRESILKWEKQNADKHRDTLLEEFHKRP